MSSNAMLERLGRPGRMIEAELMDGEQVLGVVGGKQRSFAVTNHRVVMADAGAVAGLGARSESARLSDIVSINAAMGKTTIALTNGSHLLLNYGLAGKGVKEFVQKVHMAQMAQTPSQAPASVAPRASSQGVADELGKLAKLRDQGVLTEQEFQAQKASLLS